MVIKTYGINLIYIIMQQYNFKILYSYSDIDFKYNWMSPLLKNRKLYFWMCTWLLTDINIYLIVQPLSGMVIRYKVFTILLSSCGEKIDWNFYKSSIVKLYNSKQSNIHYQYFVSYRISHIAHISHIKLYIYYKLL